MGMAASQARLLTLTSRMHDIEYKAQRIMNQKIALATQKDEVFAEYNAALDAKKIQIAFGEGTDRQYFDATFANMCGFNAERSKQYSLKDAMTGKVIVDADTYNNYEEFNSDKYAFAFAMLGMDGSFGWGDESRFNMGKEIGIGVAQDDYGDGMASNGAANLFMTDVERKVFENHKNDDKLKKPWDILQITCKSETATDADKREALKNFRNALYDNFASEIYKYMRLNKGDDTNTDPDAATAEFNLNVPETFPKEEFNYYVHLFEEICEAGGCQIVDPRYESGADGNEWLNNMVSSGRVIIEVYNKEKKQWSETNVATSTNANYIMEVSDDKDLKKAEIKYEHELGIINKKETKYDQDLKNLETERTAIKTELDSIKTVKNDNIERTFGIFS